MENLEDTYQESFLLNEQHHNEHGKLGVGNSADSTHRKSVEAAASKVISTRLSACPGLSIQYPHHSCLGHYMYSDEEANNHPYL